MPHEQQSSRIRFDCFELDLRTRELRKDGSLIRLQDLPARLLALLAIQSGELVTRAEIEKALWGEDQIVEFEHSINTAMKKIREALGDDLAAPRFIETLPRKGYRFLVPVRQVDDSVPVNPVIEVARDVADPPHELPGTSTAEQENRGGTQSLAAAEEQEFALPRATARFLFLIAQTGYLAMYAAALYKADAVQEILNRVLTIPFQIGVFVVLASAMCGIAVRLYLITSVGFDHPAAGEKYFRLFPVLFALDMFWAASPLLLARKIGFGLSLGSVAALAYLPFAQRVLMMSTARSATQKIHGT